MALKRLGKTLHFTKSRNLIVKLESSNAIPKVGAKVFNKQLSHIGLVSDVFGLVSAPYVTVKPETSSPSIPVGEPLFFSAETD